MLPAAVPQILTERLEVDVVTIDSDQPGGNVEDGMDVVDVEVEAGWGVADHQVDEVHTENDDLQAEQEDWAPLDLTTTRLETLQWRIDVID